MAVGTPITFSSAEDKGPMFEPLRRLPREYPQYGRSVESLMQASGSEGVAVDASGGIGLAEMPRAFPQYGRNIWNVAKRKDAGCGCGGACAAGGGESDCPSGCRLQDPRASRGGCRFRPENERCIGSTRKVCDVEGRHWHTMQEDSLCPLAIAGTRALQRANLANHEHSGRALTEAYYERMRPGTTRDEANAESPTSCHEAFPWLIVIIIPFLKGCSPSKPVPVNPRDPGAETPPNLCSDKPIRYIDAHGHAACAAARAATDMDKKQPRMVEYCGMICCHVRTGDLSRTGPTRGVTEPKSGCNPGPPCPGETVPVGAYHSHTDRSRRGRSSDADIAYAIKSKRPLYTARGPGHCERVNPDGTVVRI